MGKFRAYSPANPSDLQVKEANELKKAGFDLPPAPDAERELEYAEYAGKATVAQTVELNQ